MKRDELLEHLNSILEQDNQQPISLNGSRKVSEQVQRLTDEDGPTNKSDTSVPNYTNQYVVMI